MLDSIGIDYIEAGFPASSTADKEAVKRIVRLGLNAKICGFSRAVKSDIDAVIDCDCDCIVLSFPPSDIHIRYKLRMTREEYLRRAVEAVEYAKSHGLFIIYSAEDSTRAELSWLKHVFNEIVAAGVDRVRIVDTLGCITPTAMRFLVEQIRASVPAPVEVHCHNDHGLALANTLMAYEAGATVFSTSVLGLGERAGIAPTEEVILALHNLYGVDKYITENLASLCEEVARAAKLHIWPLKPVIGDNVFTHVSGIHQDGVLKNPIVYESFPPEMVGRRRKFLLSKVSGRAAVRAKLKEYGIELSDEEVNELTNFMKDLSVNRKSAFTDEEFLEIVRQFLSSRGRHL